MIRWYDYVAAIIVADVMQSFIFASLFSTVFWHSFMFSFLAYMVLDLWSDAYCKWRLKKEIDNGNRL